MNAVLGGRPDPTLADAGPRNGGTMRLCIASRAVRPVSDMVRFVEDPGGDVVPDLKRRLPGRGVWVTARRSAIAEATRRGGFGRGLRPDVRVPGNLTEQVEALLEQAALDALAIAAKAGRVVCGMTRVEAALRSGAVAVVLNAADAGPAGVRKIAAAIRRAPRQQPDDIAIIDIFASAQLDLALGRGHVVHAALLTGRDSNAVLARCAKLERFRRDDGTNKAVRMLRSSVPTTAWAQLNYWNVDD
jgi:uncharacterized protein